MDQHDTCKNKVETFDDLEIRSVKYFKESGFDKYGGEDKDIAQPPKVNASKNDDKKRQQNIDKKQKESSQEDSEVADKSETSSDKKPTES